VSDSKVRPGTAPFEFVIKRTFAAPLERVWKAWTDPDQLLRWWGPKGFTTVSAKIGELKPGGVFHYCIRSPQGQEMWGRFVYREIVRNERLVYINSFSDAEGGIGRHPSGGSDRPWRDRGNRRHYHRRGVARRRPRTP
jgi:uncharacterized protein YndB with AHSA1/START domain